MRRKYQITRNRVQRHNRLEALLEEAHIKVSSIVSDLLGISARRMLQALADGETDPTALAGLAAAQLCDAFRACPTLHPVYRRLLQRTLEELRVIEDHLGQLDQQMADLLAAHHDAVQRLAEIPGLGVDSAQQIIAEVGATATTFPSPKHLASWMGACPGNEESAGVNYSHRCPQGNRQMRRVLNQAANAAVKAKERSSPSSTVGSSPVSDMPRPSARSPTGCVDGSGRSCTSAYVTKSGDQPSASRPRTSARAR
jgi:transposase